jgi:hypothetical protein
MMSWRAWLLGGSVAFAATIGACADRAQPRFPHAVHLAELECGVPGKPACLGCNSCHAVSRKDTAHRRPKEQDCTNCHRGDAHEALAVLSSKAERPSGPIRFDHDQHLKLSELKGQCVPCHAGVVEADKPAMPPMSQCFGCHEHEDEWKRGVCTPCHSRADLSRTLPKTFLRHDEAFVRHHGAQAAAESQKCQSCHTESDCNACHDASQTLSIERRRPEKIEKRLVHRGDFMVRHAIEAQSQSARCVRCHTVDTCDACHVARGVSGNARANRTPHPPGWVGGNRDSKSSHGHEARRNIVLCASCHDQGPATNCIQCHKVGAYGGNPHPNGWQSNQSESSRMCGYCHE